MAGAAGKFGSVFRMHGRPAQGLFLMTLGAGLNSGGHGTVSQLGERYHAGSIGGGAQVVMTFGTGWCLCLWIDAMGDQHLGIGFNHLVTPSHALFLHTLLDRIIKPSGHEHPHNSRRYNLAA